MTLVVIGTFRPFRQITDVGAIGVTADIRPARPRRREPIDSEPTKVGRSPAAQLALAAP